MGTLDGAAVDRRRFLAGALAASALPMAGCAGSGSPGGAGPGASSLPATGSSGVAPPGSRPTSGPDVATVKGWIEQVASHGVRRPGYDADIWVESFIAERFRSFGLEDVRLEPVPVTRWEPVRWSLEATAAGEAPKAIECYPVPYSPSVRGLELDLAVYDGANPSAVQGRAALFDNVILHLDATSFTKAGSAPADLTGRIYDPDGTLDDRPQTLPFGIALNGVVDKVTDAGAAAFVGNLVGYPGRSCRYFVPYTGEPGKVPGVWVTGADGDWLHDRLGRGPVHLRLDIESTATPFESHNVVGELPGADDDIVMIASHHDGPWSSAVEDGSGIGMVLAQAQHWAAQPAAERPHRLRFLLQGGHMCGGAGLTTFIAAHRAELARTVLEIHLEHAALDVDEVDGKLVATDRCVPRWFFTSRIPTLERTVSEAIAKHDLRRSMILAPDAIGDQPPTDGAFYPNEGVPIVQLLSAPPYLFDEADTPDKVDVEHLLPITDAVVDIVSSTRGITAAAMRAGQV